MFASISVILSVLEESGHVDSLPAIKSLEMILSISHSFCKSVQLVPPAAIDVPGSIPSGELVLAAVYAVTILFLLVLTATLIFS